MHTTSRILEVLYDRPGQFVWLDELSALAGGQAPLWSAAEELGRRGHRLERSAQGLRLLRPTVLDAHLAERLLPVRSLGRHVICFEQVGSTNDVCFDAAARSRGPARRESLVVTAEFQRAGRGRLGRKWSSPPGANLLASVLLDDPPDQPSPLNLEALTLACGLAVAEGIEQAEGIRVELYWPNDVVLEGRKLAGVLVETRAVGRRRRVVVGFGVNVAAAPADLPGRPAVCLADLLGRPTERVELLRSILVAMDYWLWELRQGRAPELQALRKEWLSRCGMHNRRIRAQRRLQGKTQELTGRVVDVDPLVGLTLELDSGQCVTLSAATSSVVH
jgi:BirA family biotin operon repressor/biotin-[acetyl-CoA-carboxylase] ligase